MSQRAQLLWKIGTAFAVLMAGIALGYLGYSGRVQTQQYLSLAQTYTGAFSDRAALYLSRGDAQDLAMLANTASTLLFGDVILYVQVVAGGEVVVDVRAAAGDALELPRVAQKRAARSRIRYLQNGTPYVDVVKALFPLKRKNQDPISGYVRIGTSLKQLRAELFASRLSTAGIALGIWVALMGALWWGTRTGDQRPLEREADAPGAVRTPEPNDTVSAPLEAPSDVQLIGTLSLDNTRKRVHVRGQPVELSPKEFDLLTLLCQQPGKVFSNEEILSAIWSEQSFATAQDVKQYVYFLRKKLELNPKQPQLIVTVRGFGYKVDAVSSPAG